MHVPLLAQMKELRPAEIGKGNIRTKQNELEKRDSELFLYKYTY